MGGIRTRSNVLFLDFRYKGVRCREQTKLNDTPTNRKRLENLMGRIEAEILLGTFDYEEYFPNSKRVEEFRSIAERVERQRAPTPPFSEFAETWFTENELGWKYSYQITLRRSLDKHLIPAFGGLPVGQITREDILAFRAQLGRLPRTNGDVGLSPARINTILVPLRLILTEAADRFRFDQPFKNIKTLKVPRTKVSPFTLEEVRKILTYVREDFQPYFTVKFFTGMRTGEVHGLQWKYVDFSRREILVRESLVAGRMTDTKTAGSAREIPMSQMVYDALQDQHRRTQGMTYVFCNGEGNPLSVHNVTNRVWKPLLRALQLEIRKPYQTRHTAATLWLAAGENPTWVARVLGHSSVTTTLEKYARYVPNLTHQDGSAFEALLEQKFHQSEDTSAPLANAKNTEVKS